MALIHVMYGKFECTASVDRSDRIHVNGTSRASLISGQLGSYQPILFKMHISYESGLYN